MGEFYSGWRRKVGVVVLAVACLFMAAWARSLVSYDYANIPCRDVCYRIVSSAGVIRVTRIDVHIVNGKQDQSEIFAAPHWSVAILLAGLSMYFLLSERRTRKTPEEQPDKI